MIDRPAFFAIMRAAFGPLRQSQVDGIEQLLAYIEASRALLPTHAAYYLATAWHETAAAMVPVVEMGSTAYLEGLYDPVKGASPQRRVRARKMGNLAAGDGVRYRGRGYIQLTWANNYRQMGQLLGVDLLAQPDLALEPEYAYRIMDLGMQRGLFTGAKIGTFIQPDRCDYVRARRVVNGLDRAELVAGYARTFEAALRGTA